MSIMYMMNFEGAKNNPDLNGDSTSQLSANCMEGKKTPASLPNCISMMLILFSAGKRTFGGLSVKGAVKEKKQHTLIQSQHST